MMTGRQVSARGKIVLSVLGNDRPGIVAEVARILYEHGCNVENVSQTTLQTEFAAIFIILAPEDLQPGRLLEALEKGLAPLGLKVFLKPMEPLPPASSTPGERFVVTTTGPDRLGLVAGIAQVMARFSVNITNLRAVFRGGQDPLQNTMIYEVEVPPGTDQPAFRRALAARAEELGLELSMQHRRIFEAVHRV